jgi:serine protease inhibitor
MSPANPWLDTVVQKTYIRVDEEGTEAAAVTGGAMADLRRTTAAARGPAVRVHRQRQPTGTVLFLGTVHDPRP